MAAKYNVTVDFTLTRTIEIEASSGAGAAESVLSVSDEVITEILGRSYADVKETARSVVKVELVI